MDLFSKKKKILFWKLKKQKKSLNLEIKKPKFKILKLISLMMMMRTKRILPFLVDIKKINKSIMENGTNLKKMIHILVQSNGLYQNCSKQGSLMN